MKVVAGIVVLALAAGVVAAVGSAIRDSQNSQSPGAASIVLEDLRFSPNQINATVGEPITVRLTNRGLERHDLNFPSLHMPGFAGVESILEPGESRSITLRFDEPGTHTFICTLPGHAAAGMTGAVFVRP